MTLIDDIRRVDEIRVGGSDDRIADLARGCRGIGLPQYRCDAGHHWRRTAGAAHETERAGAPITHAEIPMRAGHDLRVNLPVRLGSPAAGEIHQWPCKRPVECALAG